MNTKTYEFEVDLDQEGQGALLVTDLELMLRSAGTGQYHKNSPYDEGRIWDIMALGDDDSDGSIEWYVSTTKAAAEVAADMTKAWHAYFDGYCLANVWINAKVIYLGDLGIPVHTEHYGFTDGDIFGTVYVYCREFWEWINPGGNMTQANCAAVLYTILSAPTQPVHVQFDQLEERLARGFSTWGRSRLLVARPSDDELGYSVRGFELKPSCS